MRISGFLNQKRSKKNQILSQIFDCYGVIKRGHGWRQLRRLAGFLDFLDEGSEVLRPNPREVDWLHFFH